MSGKFVAGNYRNKEYFDALTGVLICAIEGYVLRLFYLPWTLQWLLECTSSSLTPGFHCPDTRRYCERLGRLYGNGSKRVRERTWSPKSSTILSEWVVYAEKSSFSCLTDYFPSADVAVFVYWLCKGRCLICENSCWAHKLLKSSFWSNLSILCSLFNFLLTLIMNCNISLFWSMYFPLK